MQFEFGKEVRLKNFSDATGMTGVLHKDVGDGTFDVLLIHDRNRNDAHAGVLCSVVPINVPADAVEEM